MAAAIRLMTTAEIQARTSQEKSAVTPLMNRLLILMHPGAQERWRYQPSVTHGTCIEMENRNGLIVDVSISSATGMAEREESHKLLQTNVKPVSTVGEDRGYDVATHIKAVQALGVIPHVAAKRKGSAVTNDIRQSEGYTISLKIRERIEEIFGWMKTIGGMRKVKLIGREKINGQFRFVAAIYNLVRIGSLIGWWAGSHT